jgi:hypothetical protein
MKLALNQRSAEIKALIEKTVVLAKNNIKTAQIKQKTSQNKRDHISDEALEPGQVVFVRTEGLVKKLSPRYSGPFKVISKTKNDNYILENALKETLEMSYPRQKLKIVADMETEDTETREVEKILSHKTVKDKLVYEVLWKNSKLKDWLPIENFNNLEVINKLHQDIEKVVEIKKSSERLRVKNLKENKALPLVAPIKKKRGRPAKIIRSNFLFTSVCLFFLLGLVIANNEFSVRGKFRFCDQGEGNILNTENTCATLPETTDGNKFLDRQFNVTKICGDNMMRCENDVCSSNNYPLETYSWLQEVSSEVFNCEIQNRFITADDENSVVFHNNLCLAKYGECQLAKSIVVWDINIVHKCPYYLITAVNAEIPKNDILLAYDEKLLFSISDKISPKSCGDIKLLSSTEGLFITQDLRVLDLPKFDRDMMDLSKFMLSDSDL